MSNVYMTEEGMREASETFVMDDVTITGSAPREPGKTPWALMIAGAVAIGVLLYGIKKG